MARQQTQFNPATKEFEAYLDFSGGHNSEVGNERLNDNEFPRLINVDNSGRGSAKTRSGRVEVSSPTKSGLATNGQGLFNFYRIGVDTPDMIHAASGQLFVVKSDSPTVVTKINIVDGSNTDFRFQTTLPIEAAQYRGNLFVATGTKFVEVNYNSGTYTAKVVEPYIPTVQEVIYIGTNGLAANPDDYIQDGVASGADPEVIGIKPALRAAAVNVPITLTAFINRPTGYTGSIDYKWEYKKNSDTTYTLFSDFTADRKSVQMAFDTPVEYDIKVTIKKTGGTTTKDYLLSKFPVNPTTGTSDLSVAGIQRCRKIILHWDRILLSGDDVNPYQMYISDLENPRYFPVTNTINFDFGKQEPVTAIVRFQNMLVVFTRTTIQTLAGKSTGTYERYLIHDGIGCVADRSVAVVGNNVVFLSLDGIYALRPNIYRLETMNVARIDQNIQHEINVDQADACGMVHDSQYWLCFPQKKIVYRYYFERKTWAVDQSANLNIAQFLVSSSKVYNQTSTGRCYVHDRDVYHDAGAYYEMIIESKFLDLSASFNNKKLKRIYLLAKHFKTYDVEYLVKVKADSSIVLTPEGTDIVEDTVNGWHWQTTTRPNFEFLRGTAFGTWVMGETPFGDLELSVQQASIRGKCRRVKVEIRSLSTTPCELFGFALQFKLKKI